MEEKNKARNFNEYKEQNSYKKRKEEFSKKIIYVGEIQIPNMQRTTKEERQIEDRKPQISKKKNAQKAQNRRRKKIIRAEVATLAGLLVIGGIVAGTKWHSNKDLKELNQEAKANQEKEEMTYEDIINDMKTEKDVRNFLGNMYVELLEQETGDTELTTKDIEFSSREPQNYVYVNDLTGEMTLHGKTPDSTEQKLKDDGVSWTEKDDVDAYRVRKEGKIIDTMVYTGGNCYQAKEGDQYEEYDASYVSILQKMGKIVPLGLEYAEKIEEKNSGDYDKQLRKDKFMNAVLEFEKENEVQNLTPEVQIEEDDLEL